MRKLINKNNSKPIAMTKFKSPTRRRALRDTLTHAQAELQRLFIEPFQRHLGGVSAEGFEQSERLYALETFFGIPHGRSIVFAKLLLPWRELPKWTKLCMRFDPRTPDRCDVEVMEADVETVFTLTESQYDDLLKRVKIYG
jgi:hypothetical protein